MKVRNLGAIPLMGLAIAACGGGTGTSNQSVNPKDVVLTAAHVAESTSFRADLSALMSFNVSGPEAGLFNSLAGQSISYSGHLNEQNQRRNNLDLDISVGGRTIATRATLYDGTVYASSDGGSSYKTVPTNGLPQSQYGPQSALQYLESVGSVRDVGSGTADGLAVEKYRGQLDPAKLLGIVKSAFSSLKSSAFVKLIETMRLTGGSIDASIDHSGRIVVDSVTIDGSFDLSAVDSTLSGTIMTFHETVTGHFHDYGVQVLVQRPTNVTGQLNLP